jgi:hypothetical protein
MIFEEFGKSRIYSKFTTVNLIKNNKINIYLVLVCWNDPSLSQRCNYGTKLLDSVRLWDAETSSINNSSKDSITSSIFG